MSSDLSQDSETEDWPAERIIEELDNSDQGHFLLPLPVSDAPEDDFCVILIKPIDDGSFPEDAYHVGFMVTPDSTTETDPQYKTWKHLESETSINFRDMLDADTLVELDDDDSAILTIHGKALLCNIIDLCSDIANSIAYGGYTPQNAGELFKSYFKPKHDAAGIPQPRYLS